MGLPYEFTRVEFRQVADGPLVVSVGLYRADGTHKYPRAVRAPWKHIYTLPSDTTVEALFFNLTRMLAALGAEQAEPPTPPEGATGGQ